MQYVAAVSGKGWEVDRVKEQLLQSNPVLEGKWNNKFNFEYIYWMFACILKPQDCLQVDK